MKVNINRIKQKRIGTARMQNYYDKYVKKVESLENKGIKVNKMTKNQLEQVILSTRGEFGKKGRYAPNMINTIVDRQVYVGGMSYKSAAAFKRALGLKEKVVEIRKIDRDAIIEAHRGELTSVWNSIKGNKEEVDKWNAILGTSYSVEDASKILSNYFFGSK